MKVVTQRVKSASVSVDDNVISSIGPGILALVGLHVDDDMTDLQYCAKRLLNIKLWESTSNNDDSSSQPTKKSWKRHVRQLNYEVLCVSQFTLYGTVSTKYQPDYKLAMKTEQARILYSCFLDLLREGYPSTTDNCVIKDGAFGKMMDVALVNDGPVTLVIDSREEKQIWRENEVELII